MTRLEYPSDYHPLAPVIRQLRGSLKWLDQSGVSLETLQISSLLQRLEQLPKTRIKDHRAIQLAQYWQQLPYASHETLNVKRDEQLELSTHIPKILQNESVNSDQIQAQDGPLPTSEFPAVVHQRVVVESISFEQAPPENTQMDGSAELMTPSQKLSYHKGLAQDHLPQSSQLSGDYNQESTDFNTSFQSDSSFFSKPLDSNPSVASLDSPTRSKPDQLWATKPSTLSPLKPPQAASQKREAFAKLQIKSPSPKAALLSNLEPSNPALQKASPLAHVERTNFEADQMFGEICDRVWSCQACPRNSSTHLVSTGHYGAKVMFVVAYASEQDLKTGHLLMDPQERNLFNGLLKAMSLSRLEICLTSLMKCGSGEPKPIEWASCQNHFLDELQLVKPKVIVSLGYMASVMLLGDYARQGVWSRYQEIDVMPTFHPNDIITGGDTTKRNFWNHLKLVMRKVGLQSSKH